MDHEFTLSSPLRGECQNAVDRKQFRIPQLDLETAMNVACRRVATSYPVNPPSPTSTFELHCAAGTVELCSSTTTNEVSSSGAVSSAAPTQSFLSEPTDTQAVQSLLLMKPLLLMNDGSPNGSLVPYRLHEQLGAGGTSLVYRATHCESNKQVAVKILSLPQLGNPRLRERFEREIKIMRVMRHPHVVTHVADGQSGAYRYYAMELLEEGTLADRLLDYSQLSIERVLHYGRQVCEALAYLHSHGIIHRDLKPANLFLTTEDHVKIGDFGFAFYQGVERVSMPGRTCGTYAYMSPEQITNSAPVTGQSDLYAVGCILFELLTGRTPFLADSQFEMLRQHIQDAPPTLRSFCPECPEVLNQLVSQLLKKSPTGRPATARSVQVALDEVARHVERRKIISNLPKVANGITHSFLERSWR